MTTDVDDILEAVHALPPDKQREVFESLARSLGNADPSLAEASAAFRSGRSIEELVQEQGVKPITNLDDLVMADWPEDETADDIINFIRSQREADRTM